MLWEQVGTLLQELTLRWRNIFPLMLPPRPLLRTESCFALSSAAKKSVAALKNSSSALWLQLVPWFPTPVFGGAPELAAPNALTTLPSDWVEKPQWPPRAVRRRKKCGFVSKSSNGIVDWVSPRTGSSQAHMLKTGMATSSTSLKGSLCSQYASQPLPGSANAAGAELLRQNRDSSRPRKEELENRVSVCKVSASTVLYLQIQIESTETTGENEARPLWRGWGASPLMAMIRKP